jgi:hypothetical protein
MEQVEDYMLTTVDNPWNPYTNWDEWYAWDQAKGYDTPGLLARVANVSFDLSEGDQHLAVKEAIDSIVEHNFSGMHKIIRRDDLVKIS